MQISWPAVAGAESYRLNLVKDGTTHTFTASANSHLVIDSFDSATSTFTPYTGFGTYSCSVQAQLNGQWSDTLASCADTVSVRPLAPTFLVANAHNTQATLPSDTVELIWQADARTPHFKLWGA